MLSEAVANAVRHGQASNIDVVMKKSEGHLIINVRDNGKGFDGQPTQDPRQGPVMPAIGVAVAGPRCYAERIANCL